MQRAPTDIGSVTHYLRGACIALILAACGGGGAVGPSSGTDNGGNNPETGGPSAPGSPTGPAAPGSPAGAVVTTSGTTFTPATITIAPGGSVTWQISGTRHNVTFGALKPTGGDIPDTDSGGSQSRIFPAAGSYDYQCTRHSGMTGRVVVSSDATTPPPETPVASGTLVTVTASAFNPERVEIAPGGTVTWEFSGRADGIVFEDEVPQGGNIPETAAGSRVSRTFAAEGDYDYHSAKSPGVKGRVRVR